MKLLILTQNENLYLPESFAQVCRQKRDDVACIIIAPAMSTHGGPIKGFLKHWALFGTHGTCVMASRVLKSRLLAALQKPSPDRKLYSIRNVARAFRIPCYTVDKVNGRDCYEIVDRHRPELLISISCPQVVGKKLRQRFPKGCINVHGAPLPKYRGLMPAFWVLKNNESHTATTVHDLADKLDNGQILVQRPVEIKPDDTWDSLVRRTKAEGAEALLEAINAIEYGNEQRTPNRDEDATYFSFPTMQDRKAFLTAGRRFF